MTASMIISYDGTENDRDALALGGRFAAVGAIPALAYVRHAPESDPDREVLARRAAEALLRRGAQARRRSGCGRAAGRRSRSRPPACARRTPPISAASACSPRGPTWRPPRPPT